MSEARLCLPVLEQLSVAVKKRLEDWSEHPALVQVSFVFISRHTVRVQELINYLNSKNVTVCKMSLYIGLFPVY